MADYFDVFFWALFGGLFSIIGGLLIISNRKLADNVSHLAAPFAAGALLGAAFFDLLPEAVEINAEGAAFRWAVVGILIFYLLEHYLHWFHHHHDHDGEKISDKPTATLVIIGDMLHNAIDGVVIGAAFVVSLPVGIVTAIAIAAHEIPQEIGDFGVLLKTGMRRRKVLMWNIISALATLVTALITFRLGNASSLHLGAILGLSAGMFIYIAASDLIPTIHREAKGRFSRAATLLLILGVVIVGVLTDIAHEIIPETGHEVQSSQHVE